MMNDSINPIIATSIETCTLLELATFRARYPLRSLEIAGRSWVFRATGRRAAEQIMAPPISPERVMIIDDDHDPMLPAPMRDAVRERFARSEQHPIDGRGHLPAIQRPAIFADLLRRRFIEDAS